MVGFKEVSDALVDARRNTDILKETSIIIEICIIKSTSFDQPLRPITAFTLT